MAVTFSVGPPVTGNAPQPNLILGFHYSVSDHHTATTTPLLSPALADASPPCRDDAGLEIEIPTRVYPRPYSTQPRTTRLGVRTPAREPMITLELCFGRALPSHTSWDGGW